MPIDEIIDTLYGLPPAEFTQARDDAARGLRQDGLRAEAEQVKALRRPNTAAAAVNRLVRDHRDEVEAFLAAAAALRDAQFAGKGDLQEATQREREALVKLIRAGGDGVRQTLLAAAVNDEAARELRAGRLERELEPQGFETLLAHATPAAQKPRRPSPVPPPPPPPRPKPKPDDGPARAKLREAREALAAAEAAQRQAQRQWKRAQDGVQDARAAVERAQARLDRLLER